MNHLKLFELFFNKSSSHKDPANILSKEEDNDIIKVGDFVVIKGHDRNIRNIYDKSYEVIHISDNSNKSSKLITTFVGDGETKESYICDVIKKDDLYRVIDVFEYYFVDYINSPNQYYVQYHTFSHNKGYSVSISFPSNLISKPFSTYKQIVKNITESIKNRLKDYYINMRIDFYDNNMTTLIRHDIINATRKVTISFQYGSY